MVSDDEHDASHLHRPTASTSSATPFNFDDAFSDTDDDLPYEFSPTAIRQELERNLSSHIVAESGWPTDHELSGFVGKIGYSNDADNSVSTFDIDGRHDDRLSPPTQQPPSPLSRTASHISEAESLDEIALSAEFSSVNLGESPQPDEGHHRKEDEHHEQLNHPQAEHPAVRMEISENRAGPPVVRVATPTPAESIRSHTPTTPSSVVQEIEPTAVPLPITPQSVASASSTSSLRMIASTSLPTPSSSASNASSSSNFTVKHRATKSVGPSMLDKVVSKTRPSFLPPKSRAEDKKHMADWEIMMKRSRAAGECSKELRLVAYIIDNQFSLLIRSLYRCLCYPGLLYFCRIRIVTARGEAAQSPARKTTR